MLRTFFNRLVALNELRPHRNRTPVRKPTILLVSALSSECNTVRVFSLVKGWHLLIAPDISAAVVLRQEENVTIVLYDDDLPGISWQEGVRALLQGKRPTFLILLSAMHERRRAEILALGGYDSARKPLGRDILVQLANGCWTLMNDLDNAAANGFEIRRTVHLNKNAAATDFGTTRRY